MTQVKLFATTGTQPICCSIFEELKKRLEKVDGYQVDLGRSDVSVFPNQNKEVQVDEVRDRIVVVLHTQAPNVSENMVELLALLDALKRAQAGRIILVFPYMPYSRSDRKDKPRISVMAKLWASIFNQIYSIKDVILVDPHDPHLKHYFEPDADEIPVVSLLLNHLKKKILSKDTLDEWVLAYADAGATKRFEYVPSLLGIDRAYIHKGRKHNAEKPKVEGVIGDVKGKRCILIDDEILTGGTVMQDATALKGYGAKSVYMVATHPILMAKNKTDEQLIQSLANSEIDHFITSDTVPVSEKVSLFAEKFTIVPAAPQLAEAIKRKITGESLSALHKPDFRP